jgi:hypothetical protein
VCKDRDPFFHCEMLDICRNAGECLSKGSGGIFFLDLKKSPGEHEKKKSPDEHEKRKREAGHKQHEIWIVIEKTT